jgi:hypothetical protein
LTAVADDADSFPKYVGMVVGVGTAGLAGAYFLPGTPEGRLSAFVGVAGSVFAGAVALTLKRRALEKGIKWALQMLAVAFGVRVVLVGVGLVYVMARGVGAVPFTVGFFTVYLVLQWIEITYVLAETKRRSRGGLQ